ncbi:Fibrinogen-like protein 1,Ficolin-1,Ficolin-2 [Mytilus coruscus]|uniref:Fibrinogen-like protein 1,Ficolin-1,Ficolin-2 n=1 Tax=Mytilus coruscus TaxID=42192 RepID=A0A6J8EV04_MYTCO|nr:Fibrinogen-like protein 1,Ficolin-1,Ficolin-2 [Mytilus coruscus]
MCSSCSEIEDPRLCKNTTICAKDELCTHGYTNILGRRLSLGVHQECESCCSGTALCNRDLQCDHTTQKSIHANCSSAYECIGSLVCLSGKCQCPSDEYYWNINSCIERKSENERCSGDSHCKTSLQCQQNMCKCINTQYWNGFLCISKKLECEDIEETNDGVYFIYPGGGDTAVAVYCIMRQAKKWTVIQRRANGSVDFYRTWLEYKMGFGSAYGEYWLGNDNINLISTNKHHELSIYMQTESDNRTANYSTFFVENEGSKYRLAVTGYSGDAGDSMNKNGDSGKSNEQPFTTKDRDNDNEVFYNCAEKYISGWWFNSCYSADFNRAYSGQTGHMYWASWSGDISKSILMIRRTS